MRPVTVEIVAYTPTEFFHCMHCEVVWHEGGIGQKIHAEQRASALPPDLAEQYANIGVWAADLVDRYGGQIDLRVIDAVSLEGLFKILCHRLGKLPAAVIDGRDRCDATDLDRADALIAGRIGNRERDPAATGPTDNVPAVSERGWNDSNR